MTNMILTNLLLVLMLTVKLIMPSPRKINMIILFLLNTDIASIKITNL